ncbi:hypothetical protein SAMN06265337_0628 [Hymenobacter gelipurpurascens]|uniref:Uncharacterized protein n=1 Tax=Hymenobacter gelipurpurascens TaxID=89968 RepID=A0A212T870_9BACT|nr:hypothetical protein [Hymenobacter gelipurpurascens]SNC62228.1 hypothetical protein SAMN06265337_0628 [Hymenobacter gelipurpurascens]
MALCDYLLSGEASYLKIVEEVDRWLLEAARPDVFHDGDPDNVLTSMHRNFENLCALLAETGTPDAGNLPVFQFQARLAWLERKKQREHPEGL